METFSGIDIQSMKMVWNACRLNHALLSSGESVFTPAPIDVAFLGRGVLPE